MDQSREILSNLVKQWRATNGTQAFRIVAFGSSNTEIGWHSNGRHGWPCWLSISIRAVAGRRIWTTNAGIGGDTADGLRARVNDDVIAIHPHLVIITIGGNDFFRKRPLADFEADLRSLEATLRGAGAVVVFQTYYALLPEVGNSFYQYMDVVRHVAATTGSPIIDQYSWFLRWQQHDLENYRLIMLDAAHLKPVGNALFGTMAARVFGVPDPQLPSDIKQDVIERVALLEKFGAPPRAQLIL